MQRDAPPELLARLDAECLDPPWDAAGYVEFRRVGGEGWVLADPEPCGLLCFRTVADEAELLRIGIAPAARRRGLGRGLLGAFLDHCRAAGLRRVYLEVRAENPAARALYAAAGFHAISRRRGYYADPPDDALLMVLELSPKD